METKTPKFDYSDIHWQNFVNSYQIYKKDREAVKNQI